MNNRIDTRYARQSCKKTMSVLLQLLLAVETSIVLTDRMKGVLSLWLRTPFFETFRTPRFLLILRYFTNDNTVCKILTHKKCGTFLAHALTRSCDAAAGCCLLLRTLQRKKLLGFLTKKKRLHYGIISREPEKGKNIFQPFTSTRKLPFTRYITYQYPYAENYFYKYELLFSLLYSYPCQNPFVMILRCVFYF